jgi:hypothetical protein
MQPSDFLASVSRDFGSPRQRLTSTQKLVLNRPHVLLQRAARWRLVTGSPKDRFVSRRSEDLPDYWAILFMRAAVQHPAGRDPSSPLLLFEKIHGENAIAFRKNRTLGIRKVIVQEGSSRRLRVDPRPTRSRAYASPASLPRPSQGSLPARTGSPLTGRVSHPLDNERNFMETSQFLQSQSTSRAWSHCSSYSLIWRRPVTVLGVALMC